MTKYCVLNAEKSVVLTGNACVVREFLEASFEGKFGFYPMFQESEDDGELEVYLHTDTYEDLEDKDIAKLDELNITEVDSLQTICSVLELSIEPISEEEIASCSVCGKTFHETQINMTDQEDDVCVNCLPDYNSTKGNNRYIAVYSYGGIIESVEEGTDLKKMARDMRAHLEETGFYSDKDDARIFQVNERYSREVYTFKERESLIKHDDIEVYNPKEGTIRALNRNTKEDMNVFFDPDYPTNLTK